MIKKIGYCVGPHKITADELSLSEKHHRMLRDVLGVRSIYVAGDMTQLDMSIEAAKKVINNIDKNEIGLVIFASSTPEKIIPSMSIQIVRSLELDEENVRTFDINANCAGGISAVNLADILLNEYIDIKYALVVCCDTFSHFKPRDEIGIAHYGDTATCVLMERSNGKATIAYSQRSNTDCSSYIQLPVIKDEDKDYMMRTFGHTSYETLIDLVIPQMERLFVEQNISKEDLKFVAGSQVSFKIFQEISDKLDLPISKFPWFGEVYGYVGVSCPIFCLAQLIDSGKVNRGDMILLWSLGAGVTSSLMLINY